MSICKRLLLVILFFASFFIVSSVNADPVSVISNTPAVDYWKSFNNNDGSGGAFMPDDNLFINDLSFQICRKYDYPQDQSKVYYHIVKLDSCSNGNPSIIEYVATSTGYNFSYLDVEYDPSNCDSGVGIYDVFVPGVELASSTCYGFYVTSSTSTQAWTMSKVDNTDYQVLEQCSGGSCQLKDTIDPWFILSYDEDDEQIDDVSANYDWFEEAEFYFDVEPVSYCYEGYPCRLYFYYNDSLIGDTIYIVENEENEIVWRNDAFASTTISYDKGSMMIDSQDEYDVPMGVYEFYINLDDELSGTVNNYTLIVEDSDGDLYEDAILIKRYTKKIWTDYPLFDFDIEEVCASSTICPNWDEDSWKCQLMTFGCYAIYPSDNAVKYINSAFNSLHTSFPFNYYRVIRYIIDSTIENGVQGFELNLYWNGEDTGLNWFYLDDTSNTIRDAIPDLWDDNIYPLMEKIIYASFFIYIFLRIWSIYSQASPPSISRDSNNYPVQTVSRRPKLKSRVKYYWKNKD